MSPSFSLSCTSYIRLLSLAPKSPLQFHWVWVGSGVVRRPVAVMNLRVALGPFQLQF
jgi:hypothetical protein